MSEIVILTMGGDIHAALVDFVLRMMGETPRLFSTSTLLARGDTTVEYDGRNISAELGLTGRFDTKAVRSLWNRRLAGVFVLPGTMHPADRRHITGGAREVGMGLGCVLDAGFAVNPIESYWVLANKLNQLRVASELNIKFPRTLVSSNPKNIREFARSVKSPCVKAFDLYTWNVDGGQVQSTAALLDDANSISDESFSMMPLIYQEFIEKSFEVRVVIFGGCVIATKISVQHDPMASIDWRANNEYLDHLEPIAVPEVMLAQMRAIMAKLRLRFGAFDFAVDKSGNWIFLEVNEAGQFLWQEQFCPSHRILEPFARYLASASDNFTFDDSQCSAEFTFEVVGQEVMKMDLYRELIEEPALPRDVLSLGEERTYIHETSRQASAG